MNQNRLIELVLKLDTKRENTINKIVDLKFRYLIIIDIIIVHRILGYENTRFLYSILIHVLNKLCIKWNFLVYTLDAH